MSRGMMSQSNLAPKEGSKCLRASRATFLRVFRYRMSATLQPFLRCDLKRGRQPAFFDAVDSFFQFPPPPALSFACECLALGPRGFVNHPACKTKPVGVDAI